MPYAIVIIYITRHMREIENIIVFHNDQDAADYYKRMIGVGKPCVLSKAYSQDVLPEKLLPPPFQEQLI